MTQTIEKLIEQLKSQSYKKLRTKSSPEPILFPVDVFGFHIGNGQTPHSLGGNVIPDYNMIISKGFDEIRNEIEATISASVHQSKKDYGAKMLRCLDECIAVCDAYRQKVKSNKRLYDALQRVPHKSATTFFEACLFMKICLYFLRTSNTEHICLGRFDQYMYPYFLQDKSRGVSDEELFETLEAFFVSLNFDGDLYPGIQLGDNGQSMVLGGFDEFGNSQYNNLSDMCMDASLELNLIDPKINLRVGKNTPYHIYKKATLLTKQGLGFPQYCNDDVVVPGLIKLGYEPKDAQNYGVAACWEFIPSGCGADIPNMSVMNFPLVVNSAITEKLTECDSFEDLMGYVEAAISDECDRIIRSCYDFNHSEQPLLSLFTAGCIENLSDMWSGAKYINYGCHGTGISNATDALAAVKVCVFDEKTISANQLIDSLNGNFDGFSQIRNALRRCPKMGNNDPVADDIAVKIMTCFSKNMNNRPNGKGGIWRAGTGSAMEYILSAAKCPATADGRLAFEPYSSSFSPSLDVKTSGILSTIQSFTKYDMTEIINGGPLTLEIHDSVLKNDMGIEKTATLVKLYVELGGHQLQLNSINRERLLDAQKHPEKHPNLIVRVWGWSGYFNELDKEYQNHIIRRCEYLN